MNGYQSYAILTISRDIMKHYTHVASGDGSGARSLVRGGSGKIREDATIGPDSKVWTLNCTNVRPPQRGGPVPPPRVRQKFASELLDQVRHYLKDRNVTCCLLQLTHS